MPSRVNAQHHEADAGAEISAVSPHRQLQQAGERDRQPGIVLNRARGLCLSCHGAQAVAEDE